MAKSTLNSALLTLRGEIHGWIYRKIRGKMVVSPAPEPSTAAPTQAQLDARALFTRATEYANKVMANPTLRPIYERVAKELEQPTFAIAVGDFFKSPAVTSIETAAYTGKVGDKIEVMATDDVEVASVTVILRQTDDTVIEQGSAVLNGKPWFYTATTAIPAGHAIKIDVRARDHPGNEGMLVRPFTVPA